MPLNILYIRPSVLYHLLNLFMDQTKPYIQMNMSLYGTFNILFKPFTNTRSLAKIQKFTKYCQNGRKYSTVNVSTD